MWWLPPSPGRGESCEFVFACGSSMHQKCSNYALTNLLFGLCRSMWIIDLLVTRPNPHPRTLAHLFYPQMLRAREHTSTLYFFVVFTFGLIVEFVKEFGSASLQVFVRSTTFNFNCCKIIDKPHFCITKIRATIATFSSYVKTLVGTCFCELVILDK